MAKFSGLCWLFLTTSTIYHPRQPAQVYNNRLYDLNDYNQSMCTYVTFDCDDFRNKSIQNFDRLKSQIISNFGAVKKL